MSQFKVGDICRYYNPSNPTSKNQGKIFTLTKYIGRHPKSTLTQAVYWETDCPLWWATIKSAHYKEWQENACREQLMRKLDNPGDEVVDEMIKIVGPAPKVKETTHAL